MGRCWGLQTGSLVHLYRYKTAYVNVGAIKNLEFINTGISVEWYNAYILFIRRFPPTQIIIE